MTTEYDQSSCPMYIKGQSVVLVSQVYIRNLLTADFCVNISDTEILVLQGTGASTICMS